MKVFLATHGRMASGMKTSLDILLGDTEALTAHDCYVPDEEGTLQEHMQKFYDDTPEDEVKLLISDVYGGSVCQQMTIFAAGKKNTYVITGINLGLLMQIMSTVDEEFDLEQLDAAIEESRETTMRITIDADTKNDNDADFF